MAFWERLRTARRSCAVVRVHDCTKNDDKMFCFKFSFVSSQWHLPYILTLPISCLSPGVRYVEFVIGRNEMCHFKVGGCFLIGCRANPGGLCAQVVCDWSIKEVNGGILEGLLPAKGGSWPAKKLCVLYNRE